jgi:glycosyltransferase involved in cell wall biosynthesis
MNKVSIIIPAYNEADFAKNDLPPLMDWLDSAYGKNYELIVVENGSTDGSLQILQDLAKSRLKLIVEHLDKASFGEPVRRGIEMAAGDVGVLLNADWLDRDFVLSGVEAAKKSDMVIGSKVLSRDLDHRPWVRRQASTALTLVLKHAFGFQFSDSHGLKAFRLGRVKPLATKCTMNEIVESELLLRIQHSGLSISEIPVEISETRAPRVSFVKRIGSMGKELVALYRLQKSIIAESK